jgi:oxygen-independent coproporphyrinogen-3 oxidase
MRPDYIGNIIDSVKEKFKVKNDAEITLETNPGTVSLEKLIEFRSIGINRISIGIQSFDDDDLKFLTRIHNSETAIRTVNDTERAGFENISLDLIFNLPGQTKKKWIENLNQSINLPIKHISAYSLILERGTILNKMVLDGKVIMQNDDYDADLYETTIDFLTSNGFYQYEVSNFAKPGYECIHNNAYWHYVDYLGFGTSAHSFIQSANGTGNKRWWNLSSLKMYIDSVEQKSNAVAGSELINKEKSLNEFVMLGLRSSGIDINCFEKYFGKSWLDNKYSYFKMLADSNLVFMDNSSIKLTAGGYAICDEILKELF